MTLEEALVELRELRWELQQQRWQDTATLARLWSGSRCYACHADDGFPVSDRVLLVRVEMTAQRRRGRQLEALRLVEQLARGPRLDVEAPPPFEWCAWFEAGDRVGHFSCCAHVDCGVAECAGSEIGKRMRICEKCKWRTI